MLVGGTSTVATEKTIFLGPVRVQPWPLPCCRLKPASWRACGGFCDGIMTLSVSTRLPEDTCASSESPSDGQEKKPKKGKKYYGRTAKVGALWSLVRQAGHELIAIPTSVIMARLLAPEDFGIAAAASFFVLLAARLTQFGFNSAIVRIKELRPDHTASVFVVNLVLGVLMYVALVAAAPAVGGFLRSPEAASLLPVAALSFLLTPFGTVPSALLSRRMEFKYNTASDWADSLAGAVISVFLAFRGFGFWSLVYGQLAGTACRIALKVYLTDWRPSFKLSRRGVTELLSFGLGLQAKRLLEYATYNLDTLVVGRVLGMTALGLYDKAFTTMNRIVNRLTLGQAYFRIFSIIHEEPVRFRRAYSRLVLTISVLGLPAFAAAIVVARPLFVLMYGERWLPAVLPFQLLCVGGVLKLLNAYASQANEATGNIWAQTARQAFGTVCIIVGAFVGARFGGIPGAATGVAIGMAVLTVSMQALVKRTTGLTWEEMIRPQLPAVACTLLVVSVMLAIGWLVSFGPADGVDWELLLLQALGGGFAYACFILFSPFASLNEVVTETVHQLLPSEVAARLDRLRRTAAVYTSAVSQ
jgi:O-antigen/teichoic acid export membrane protein